ncbi:hypothetical protein HMN09_00410500 [Mycena chlorophos]|uniref:Transferase family protein n=1 Tax=Mycena chlorophos TaxID=658473 RepID=A0A8H6TGE3_MYCCL|nr:hypothetical protein HMN09_00410500 [Mycena chlorophos]
MSVSILERIPIHASEPPTDPFTLGPFDQTAGFVPIQVVWLYEDAGKAILPVERLRRAMELLLLYYPHVSGRIHVDPQTGLRQITNFAAGAEFVVATCNSRLDSFAAPSPGRIMALPGAGNALLPPFDPNPASASSQPILAVQRTQFVCGAVSLGIRMAHTVCDGSGYFILVRHLAELCRGLAVSSTPTLACPPQIKPFGAELIGSEVNDDVPEPTIFTTKAPSGSPYIPPPYPPIGRFLRFTRQQLAELKQRATEPGGTSWVTTFEALAAHLHRRIYRARLKLFSQDPTLGVLSPPDYLSPVDTRTRLGISEDYFPNALFLSTLRGDDLEHLGLTDNGPLWKTAKAIHEAIRARALTDPAELDKTIRWIARQPNFAAINNPNFRYGTGSFMFSAWSKFDYIDLQFETGLLPVLACPPFTTSSTVDGLGYTLPPERGAEEGDVDVNLVLLEPLWPIFDKEMDL